MKALSKKIILKIAIHFLVYSALFVLFICFFLIDQFKAFASGRSTIATQNVEAEVLEFPTLTFCFDPATKASVSQKYGFTDVYFRNHLFVEKIPI